jgi:formyltetrahydrofolate hydrolase
MSTAAKYGGKQQSAILLIVCPDQKGLVAGVSDFVYRYGGNILHVEQHVDAQQGVFFHRLEWDMNGFALAPADIGAAFTPSATRFGMSWDLRFSWHRPRIAIFVSKYHHCLPICSTATRSKNFQGKSQPSLATIQTSSTCPSTSGAEDCAGFAPESDIAAVPPYCL